MPEPEGNLAPVPDDLSRESLANKLRRLRLAKRWTQENLAEYSALGETTISQMERGRTLYPQKDTVDALVSALGIDGDEEMALRRITGQRRYRGVQPPSPPAGGNAGRTPTRAAPIAITDLLPPPYRRRDAMNDSLARARSFVEKDENDVLVVHGPLGSGKTRLINEAVKDIAPSEVCVLLGRAYPTPGRPCEPILRAIEDHKRDLGPRRLHRYKNGRTEILAVTAASSRADLGTEAESSRAERSALGSDDNHSLGYGRILATVRRYLASIAGMSGTVLVLDDLHWADADTLNLIGALVDEAAASSLRIIVAYDDAEVTEGHPLRAALDALRSKVTLRPEALPSVDRVALLEWMLQGVDGIGDVTPARILEKAQASPLLLILYGWAVRIDALNPTQIDRWPTDTVDVARRILDVFPALETVALDIAAVLSRPASLAAFQGAIYHTAERRQPIDALRDALERLCDASVLYSDGKRYEWKHDVFRRAAYSSLTSFVPSITAREIATTSTDDRDDDLTFLSKSVGEDDILVKVFLSVFTPVAHAITEDRIVKNLTWLIDQCGQIGAPTAVATYRHLKDARERIVQEQYDNAVAQLTESDTRRRAYALIQWR